MLLGLAGGFLKSLGGKKKKEKTSGQEMANNITNKPNEKGSSLVVTKEKKSIVKGSDITPLKDIGNDLKKSSGKNKDPLNLALDGIDNALFGIIDTLTETNAIRKKIKKSDEEDELVEKKRLRERMLEGAAGFIKGATGVVNEMTGGGLDKFMNFLTQTLLGALVNTIVKNIENIKKQINQIVEDLKGLYDSPVLKALRGFAMWVIKKGIELTKMILPSDIDVMKKDNDKLKKELGIVEDQYKKIEKGIEDGKKKASGEVDVSSDANVEGEKPPVESKETKKKPPVESKETKQKPNVLNYKSMFDPEFNAYNMVQKKDNSKDKSKYMSALDESISRYKKWMAIYEDPSSTAKQKVTSQRWSNYFRNIINRETGYNIIDSTNFREVGDRAPNDVSYDLSTQTFSKDLKQSPKIVKKFPQPLSLKNTVSSYAVGLESYSDDFEESSIILSSEGEGGSMNNGSKTPMFFGGSSDGLNIEDLYKIKINQ